VPRNYVRIGVIIASRSGTSLIYRDTKTDQDKVNWQPPWTDATQKARRR